MTVVDDGVGFVRGQTLPPGTPRLDAAGEERIGGWGLPLIEMLADKVEFLPNEPHGTIVRAEKLLTMQEALTSFSALRMPPCPCRLIVCHWAFPCALPILLLECRLPAVVQPEPLLGMLAHGAIPSTRLTSVMIRSTSPSLSPLAIAANRGVADDVKAAIGALGAVQRERAARRCAGRAKLGPATVPAGTSQKKARTGHRCSGRAEGQIASPRLRMRNRPRADSPLLSTANPAPSRMRRR